MLLTKKTEYAILSLASIAKTQTPKNVELLSKELNIPKAYLAKILQEFSKNGILLSFKGTNGGFILALPPEELSILKITEISEDKNISVFECSSSIDGCPSNKAQDCNLWPMLNKLQLKIDDFLGQITLKDILT